VNILDILRQAQGGNAVANLARTFKIDPAAADAVLASVVPQLSQRIERNTLNRGGVADLVGAIGEAAGRGYLDNPQALATDAAKSDGIGILDQILWSKDQSRAVAHRAAQSSGVSEALIKQMLPVIAAMFMGGMAKGASGSLTDILSKIPGLPGAMPNAGGNPLPMPGGGSGDWGGGSLGGGGLGGGGMSGSPLPMPGGGTAGGGFGGQSPLPIPGGAPGRGGWGGSNPYGDLPDVIRRGGQSIPGTGGTLGNIIRGILGGLLGFQNRGVISWILRYVVLRYGMNIVRWFFSRLLLGRRV
jgi:hypothetical protein